MRCISSIQSLIERKAEEISGDSQEKEHGVTTVFSLRIPDLIAIKNIN
ncbi:hypothetical protein [Candidatus Chlamydia corallus]|nr:hypothetical protein [Candidatus Chlamydia corallus]